MGLGRHELHTAPADCRCLLVQPDLVGGARRTARPTNDDQAMVAPAAGELAQSRDREVRALQVLEPSGEQEQWAVRIDAERSACLGAIPRTEEGVVDAEFEEVSDDKPA